MLDCKIIFLDIDGTLTNSQKVITQPTLNALLKAQEMGITLAIASGRPDMGILSIAKQLRLDTFGGYMLSFNGARVRNLKTNELIYQNSLPLESFRLAYKLSKQYDLKIIAYNDENIISEVASNKYMDIEAKITTMPIKVVPNMVEYIDYNPPKCLILGDAEYLATVEPEIKSAMGDLANVYRSEPFFIEVVPTGIDKAVSIQTLIDHLGIELSQTMAFGDGFNDISMIDYVACGVAMSNACDEVKAHANHVTLSNDEDGIAVFLNKYLFS
jgi:hypothetical protein